jgi:hypothetical protein
LPPTALQCSPPQDYELRCRGGGLEVSTDTTSRPGFRTLTVRFRRGAGAAPGGLAPGQCSWMDRAVGPGEPDTIREYVRLPTVTAETSTPNSPPRLRGIPGASRRLFSATSALGDANKYWSFCASNGGDHFNVSKSGPVRQ